MQENHFSTTQPDLMFHHLSTPPRARLLQTQIIFQSTHQINRSKPKSFFNLPSKSISPNPSHSSIYPPAPNPNHSTIYPPDQLLQTQIILPSAHQINRSKPKSFFHLLTRSISPNPNHSSICPPAPNPNHSTHLINCCKHKSFFHIPTKSIAPNPNHSSICPPDNCSKTKSFFHLLTRSVAPNSNHSSIYSP